MMEISGHRPILKGSTYVCLDCGRFLLDVRTGARLRQLTEVDPRKLAAVINRFPKDPDLAERLIKENPREVVAAYKFADKYNDFLMNPKARPDLQTPEAQKFLQALKGYHNTKTDPIMPWLTREWKKGRVKLHPHGPGAQGNALQFDGGPEYEHTDPYGNPTQLHNLNPDTLNHWADWYGSDHPSRQGQDIMQMKTPEVHQTIKDWDMDMRDKAGGAAQKRGDIVHSYPDGWTVQQLTEPNQLEDEGEKMGHCVGSYGPSVQRGESLIYSLRDHQNEPHATWEITPKWHEGEDGKLYSNPDGTDETDERHFRTTPSPKEGTMEQIQGKGNKPPIEDYQKRIKDYFEKTMPDPKDRPQWDDQSIDGPEDLIDPEEGEGYVAYHPGDYGIQIPNMQYDWDSILHKSMPELRYGDKYSPKDLVAAAQEHGQLHEFDRNAEKFAAQHRKEKEERIKQNWGDFKNMASHEYHERDPEPYEEDFEDPKEFSQANEAWQKRYNEWDADREGYHRNEQMDQWKDGAYLHQLETELAAEKIRQEQAQTTPVASPPIISSSRASHPHYSTGEPCYCTFNKEPVRRWSHVPVCEACGDPLFHGKCKRCDWSAGPSDAMTDGEPIADVTKEMKPGIQA